MANDVYMYATALPLWVWRLGGDLQNLCIHSLEKTSRVCNSVQLEIRRTGKIKDVIAMMYVRLDC